MGKENDWMENGPSLSIEAPGPREADLGEASIWTYSKGEWRCPNYPSLRHWQIACDRGRLIQVQE